MIVHTRLLDAALQTFRYHGHHCFWRYSIHPDHLALKIFFPHYDCNSFHCWTASRGKPSTPLFDLDVNVHWWCFSARYDDGLLHISIYVIIPCSMHFFSLSTLAGAWILSTIYLDFPKTVLCVMEGQRTCGKCSIPPLNCYLYQRHSSILCLLISTSPASFLPPILQIQHLGVRRMLLACLWLNDLPPVSFPPPSFANLISGLPENAVPAKLDPKTKGHAPPLVLAPYFCT